MGLFGTFLLMTILTAIESANPGLDLYWAWVVLWVIAVLQGLSLVIRIVMDLLEK